MYLLREVRELERMTLPWLFILVGNTVSVWFLQHLVHMFETPTRQAKVCLFLAWYAHHVPVRLKLQSIYTQLEAPHRRNLHVPPQAQPFIYRSLQVMLVLGCFMLCVAATMDAPLWVSLLLLVVFVWAKHALSAVPWHWPSQRMRSLFLGVKIWISLLTYGTAAAYFFIMQRHEFVTQQHQILVGLGWPLMRHVARWALSKLLADPHGTRGTVRVYTSLALDLPVLAAIYSQDRLESVWTLLICLAFVDSLALVVMELMGIVNMFALSNQLWMNLIALSFLLTLRKGRYLSTLQMTQRVWYATMYLGALVMLPFLYHKAAQVLWTCKCPLSSYQRVIPATEEEEEEEEKEPGCCPKLHTDKADVVKDTDLDFSDQTLPASRHVLHLLSVVAQSDSICFALQAVFLIVKKD